MTTNKHGINTSLAVWLANDEYTGGKDEAPLTNSNQKLVSATTLIKPIRQQVLTSKLEVKPELDVSSLVASSIGTAIHDSIEKAWTGDKLPQTMKELGYSNLAISKAVVNPTLIKEGDIPIYLEQRGFKAVDDDYMVTGQLDFCLNGTYHDFKYTSTMSYSSGSKDQDYTLQGSIYRGLMPDIITEDVMYIDFIFNNWNKFKTKEKGYPPSPVYHKSYKLMSLDKTDAWVRQRLSQLKHYLSVDETNLIECSDKELWKSPSEWGYYADPTKTTGRRTKVFHSAVLAHAYLASKGVGVVVEKQGQAKACTYCPASSICTQFLKMRLEHA